MTTQTAEKSERQRKAPSAPSHEEIQATYQCHTLAQILYTQILANHPWLARSPTWGGPASDPRLVQSLWPGPGEVPGWSR